MTQKYGWSVSPLQQKLATPTNYPDSPSHFLTLCFSASQNGKVVEYLSKMQQITENLSGVIVECHTP